MKAYLAILTILVFVLLVAVGWLGATLASLSEATSQLKISQGGELDKANADIAALRKELDAWKKKPAAGGMEELSGLADTVAGITGRLGEIDALAGKFDSLNEATAGFKTKLAEIEEVKGRLDALKETVSGFSGQLGEIEELKKQLDSLKKLPFPR